ncbi:hypothetical protein [Selenomonas sp. AB3002]|uniref:hypothetical protein n=1 Tax=Selenomonas sp. AB3002 TaxID=1392502 RepID=UPI0004979AE8
MRSPEKLDTTMTITTPIGWMGLIAVAVMLLAVVIWSVFGSFTVKADGMGLIMDPSGVAKDLHPFRGHPGRIVCASRDTVEKGSSIAHVSMVQEEACHPHGPAGSGAGRFYA